VRESEASLQVGAPLRAIRSHNDPLPVSPLKRPWLAVKELIETDGALPKSIEWVADKDLPAGTFPDPGSPHLDSQYGEAPGRGALGPFGPT